MAYIHTTIKQAIESLDQEKNNFNLYNSRCLLTVVTVLREE